MAERAGAVMVGRTVSHYRILEELGGGGMGVVYRAEDTRLKRTVALKFLAPELTRDPAAKRRFVKEAQAASSLDHPNICTIHEIEETEDGQLFLALACYEGETVKDRLLRGPMPVEEVAGLGVQVARGLSKAHARGIVHRDIKPANVFVTEDGRAKILDFGLAMLAGQTRVTKAGSTVGTVAYMSPEQARGHEIDSRTDVWSLGVVMYEALTGELPFRGDRPESLLYSVVHEDPRHVAELRSDVREDLAAAVMKCLEKDPGARWSSAEELTAALEAVLGVPSSSFSEIRLRATATLPSRREARRGLWIGLVVVLLVAAGFSASPSGRRVLGVWFATSRIPDEKHVVILPMTGGRETDETALACGFRHYLSFRLSQLEQYHPGFRMVPVGGFSHEAARSPDEARNACGATIVLEGSIDMGPQAVAISLDAVETASSGAFDSWTTEESPANVAALQLDPVLETASMMGVEVREEQRQRLTSGATTVPGAFEPYLEGLGHLRSAEWDTTRTLGVAVELLRRAIELDASYALAYAALAEARWEQYKRDAQEGMLAVAESTAQVAVDMDDRLASPHVTLARVRNHEGEQSEAIRELRRALEIDPLDFYARRELAEQSEAEGDYTLAELAYSEAVDLRRGYWLPHFDMGHFYYERGRYDDAASALRAAAELAPGNAHVWNALGAVYYQMDLLPEAREALERAVGIQPSYATYSNLGTLYFGEARYADACDMYRRALAMEPERYTLWGNLGAACKVVPGAEDDAHEAYTRAAELAEKQRLLRPRDADVLAGLASYYAELGETERALDLISEALELAPNDIEVMFHSGHTYEVLGDRESALNWIRKAVENGYSRAQVESTPALRKLCTDERYRRLVHGQGDAG
jgi:serine/threonine-protein kinase